jgi:hypothetical protein
MGKDRVIHRVRSLNNISYPQVIHRLILLIILLDTLEVEQSGG